MITFVGVGLLLLGFILGWTLSSVTYGYKWRVVLEKTDEALQLNEQVRLAQAESDRQVQELHSLIEEVKASAKKAQKA